MTPLENCLSQKQKLTERINEYKDKLSNSHSDRERSELKQKILSYRSALKDIQVQIDYLDPPEERKARKAERKKISVDGLGFDFYQYSGETWADLEGNTWSNVDGLSWSQIEDGDFHECSALQDETLQEWLAEGANRLTEKQRIYIDAYYNQGLSLEMIANTYNVDKSTAARCIKNGLARMEEWVSAKKMIASCAQQNGRFDWTKYLATVPVLTDRQRQLMLLVLSGLPKTQDELADKLDLEESTISRTLSKATETIKKLNVDGGAPVSRPRIRSWEHADKYSLAIQTGMPLHFYYRYCFRGQYVGGLSRYNYELAWRQKAGRTAEDTAKEMGLKVKTVRCAYQRLKNADVQVKNIEEPKEGTIGARLDPATYQKLQRLMATVEENHPDQCGGLYLERKSRNSVQFSKR